MGGAIDTDGEGKQGCVDFDDYLSDLEVKRSSITGLDGSFGEPKIVRTGNPQKTHNCLIVMISMSLY